MDWSTPISKITDFAEHYLRNNLFCWLYNNYSQDNQFRNVDLINFILQSCHLC